MNLAAQQQALLRALWQPRHEDAARALAPWLRQPQPQAERGLRAYRSNGRELAARALAGAYPVLAQLLGEENFGPLARAHWLRHPPVRGDLAHWGEALAAHLETLAELVGEEPYLPDVARLEWALHRLASAADAALDRESFALLGQQDPARLRLCLAPGTALQASRWPVASIVLAHLAGAPSLAEAGERLRQGLAETALLWREGPRPRVRAAGADEALLLAAVKDGGSLADTLQAAPALDFAAWLAPAVQCGLVTGVAPL